MTIPVSGSYRSVDFTVSNQLSAQEVSPSRVDVKSTALEHQQATVELKPVRDSLDISLRAAISTMLASHPLVNTLSNEERAQLVGAVEFSLKQGIGISSLIRIIERSR